MTTKKDIIAEARKWLDTPFRHQGRTEGGIDCAGLCLRVIGDTVYNGKRIGVETYPHAPPIRLVYDQLNKFCDRIPKEQASGGDIVLLQYNDMATHMGFLTDDETVVHGYIRSRKVVESRLGTELTNRVVACFRVKNLSSEDVGDG